MTELKKLERNQERILALLQESDNTNEKASHEDAISSIELFEEAEDQLKDSKEYSRKKVRFLSIPWNCCCNLFFAFVFV